MSAGRLPAWATGDLPEPPRSTPRNTLRVIGRGAVLLAFSVGAGEWLLGPAAVAGYGATILWITTASVVLQALLNTEMGRYTLYTGEPIFTGFLRTAPGPTFWGWTYAGLHLLQIGWPGWALAAATAVTALFLGRVPDEGDRVVVLYFGYLTFLASVLLVLVGETVEKTLEYAQWFMICWILAFLLLTGLFLVPPDVWVTAGAGFLSPLLGSPFFPPGVDWFLLAGFAAYAGAGGTINATFTHWLRDKGFGMSGTVGYVQGIIGGQRVNLSSTGVVFPPSEENLRRWKGWWRYLRADQWYLWTPGCIVGMGLPALTTLTFIPPGTTMGGYGIGAYQAQALAEHYGPVLWFLTLLNSFWILFSTQLGNTEGFARVTTDIFWASNDRTRAWRGGNVRTVYYSALLAFAAWGCVAIALTDPLTLILIGANVAAWNLVILSAHTLVVNRKFLPRELRPPLWREAGLALSGLFFLGFALFALGQRVLAMW
jgi:hypothetical protein